MDPHLVHLLRSVDFPRLTEAVGLAELSQEITQLLVQVLIERLPDLAELGLDGHHAEAPKVEVLLISLLYGLTKLIELVLHDDVVLLALFDVLGVSITGG